MTRRFSCTLVVTLLVPLGAAGCSQPRASAVTEGAPAVSVVAIARGDIAQVQRVAAEFRPFQEIEVHAKVSGFVKAISVDVGDRVKAGQLLAVLEVPELQDDLHHEQAAVKRAREEINRAQADLERAGSVHEVAHLGSARLSAVLKARPNLVAQQDIDEATGRDRIAEAQVSTAKAALASAQEQLEVARAGESKTQTLVRYSQITAPFAGVITHRYADTGAMIQAGTSSQTQTMPLVRLSQNTKLRLVVPVPESSVARIHVGAPVDLEVQALHKTFTGTIARLADRLDSETRTMRIEVDMENPTLEIVPGMYANVSLVLDRVRDVLVAPVEALHRTGTASQILVVNPERRIETRDVTVGLESEDRVEIKAGLHDGDLVVLGSRGQLKAGTLVTPKVAAASPEETGAR